MKCASEWRSFNTLPSLVWHEDEPIAWPSSVSLYYVSRLASEQVKVVLTGEGSDELFGGYARYGATLRNQRWMRWYGVVPARLETACENRLLRRACSPAKLAGRSSTLRSAARTAFSRSFSIISIARFPYQTYLDRWEQRASSSPLARMLFADQKTYLVELLMKQDQISMAASIESRVPFLDHPFRGIRGAGPRRTQDSRPPGQVHIEESRG